MARSIKPRFKIVFDFPDMSFLWRARIAAETPTEGPPGAPTKTPAKAKLKQSHKSPCKNPRKNERSQLFVNRALSSLLLKYADFQRSFLGLRALLALQARVLISAVLVGDADQRAGARLYGIRGDIGCLQGSRAQQRCVLDAVERSLPAGRSLRMLAWTTQGDQAALSR